MRQLIVYYSLDGDTEFVARELQKETGAELLRLQPKKEYPKNGAKKFLVGGMHALLGTGCELVPCSVDLSRYDCILLGCPVWAGRLASPMQQFLKEHPLQGKRVKLFLCHGDEKDEKPMARFKKALSGNTVIADIAFVNPRKKQGGVPKEGLMQFVNAH